MTALWVVAAAAAFLYVISHATAMPAARGVPVSARLAEARALVARPQPRVRPVRSACAPTSAGRRRVPGRTQPRSRLAYCDGRAALAQRQYRRS